MPPVGEVMWRVLSPSSCTMEVCVSGCSAANFCVGKLAGEPRSLFLRVHEDWREMCASNSFPILKRMTFLAHLFEKWTLFPLLFPSQYLHSFLSTSLPLAYLFLPWLKAGINSVCVTVYAASNYILQYHGKVQDEIFWGSSKEREDMLHWLTLLKILWYSHLCCREVSTEPTPRLPRSCHFVN